MTNRDEANKLASKITGETVNAATTKEALEAISGKKAGTIAQAIDDIVKGDIPGGDLEDNKEATIDVSAYTDPVEITPTQGKDGMKKVTLTLSNIPSGGTTAYNWTSETANYDYFTNFDIAPETLTNAKIIQGATADGSMIVEDFFIDDYVKISDTSFECDGDVYVRDPTKDFTLW